MGDWSEEITEPGWISPYLEDGDRYFQYMVCLQGNVWDTAVLEEVTVSWNQTGTGEQSPGTGYMVCPSPARYPTSICFCLEESSPVSLRVIDLTGRTVFLRAVEHSGGEEQTVPLPQLNPGVYFLVLNSDVSNLTERFAVVR